MAVETPAPKHQAASRSESAKESNIRSVISPTAVAIDTHATHAAASRRETAASRRRDTDEDLARLQDQLMDVLEENQQLRAELDAWRIGARAFTQQNRAS